MFSGIKRKDLLIKFFLQKHGQVKWNFSNLSPLPTPPTPPTPYLPVPLYPREVHWSVQACPKIPHYSTFLPNPFGTSGKASNFLPSILPVTQGRDGDSAEFLLLPPEPILPLSDRLCVEGLLSPTTSPKPPHTHQAFGKQGHHSWNMRSFIILLSLSGSEGREFMNFWPRFFYTFQTNRITFHHSDSLRNLIYRCNRLLFKECIHISK